MTRARAYLAGPDVFRTDPLAIAARKKARLREAGIEGVFPLDNTLSPDGMTPREMAMAIAGANEAYMRDVAENGRPAFILADMTPWHGPSMDVGTAFEVGFMSALAFTHPHVTVIGYDPDPRPFADRVIEDWYDGVQPERMADGALIGPDGMAIEDFGEADNLMITHAIAKTGGIVAADFEAAVRHAEGLLAPL
jgi:nucleoside 2-deoxyribosyltransferase